MVTDTYLLGGLVHPNKREARGIDGIDGALAGMRDVVDGPLCEAVKSSNESIWRQAGRFLCS